jgi:hypothetical protein
MLLSINWYLASKKLILFDLLDNGSVLTTLKTESFKVTYLLSKLPSVRDVSTADVPETAPVIVSPTVNVSAVFFTYTLLAAKAA